MGKWLDYFNDIRYIIAQQFATKGEWWAYVLGCTILRLNYFRYFLPLHCDDQYHTKYMRIICSCGGNRHKTSNLILCIIIRSLHWRHNDHDGVSNHQPHGCLLNLLFRRRSKKTWKLRVTGLCVGNSPGPVNSPHKGPVTRKMFPFDDVIISHWCGLGHRRCNRGDIKIIHYSRIRVLLDTNCHPRWWLNGYDISCKKNFFLFITWPKYLWTQKH